MKKTLFILGAGVVAGAVAYAVWREKQKDENKNFERKKECAKPMMYNPPSKKNGVEEEFLQTKNLAAINIAERHEQAAQIMQDTIDIICNKKDNSMDEIKELEQISNGLDDLLKKE
ncbi:MAG: hypothetical protein J6V50_03820 [Clostridia bacterium]|nr:hypothetical protein [Clostridia bacterium]